MEKKLCTKCKIEKNLDNFSKDKHTKCGYTHQCKQCRNERTVKYYKDNPDKAKDKNERQRKNRKDFYSSQEGIKSSRRSHLKRRFNMTIDQYDEMAEKQNHKCAICNESEVYSRNKFLCVDHDHKTGERRGLLCNKCNRGLGLFKDDQETLIKAIQYLENFKIKTNVQTEYTH